MVGQLLVSMAGAAWNTKEHLWHPLVWDGYFMGQPLGEKTPTAALLVFEPGDFSVVDAVALQGSHGGFYWNFYLLHH